MDLLDSIKIERNPATWVRFPNTQFELKILKLSLNEMQRVSRKATKGRNVKDDLLVEESYPRVIHGFRNMVLAELNSVFQVINFQSSDIETPITQDPIEPKGLRTLIEIGKLEPQFNYFIKEQSGFLSLVPEAEEEEEEKKTL